jgi:hypothetical protein
MPEAKLKLKPGLTCSQSTSGMLKANKPKGGLEATEVLREPYE